MRSLIHLLALLGALVTLDFFMGASLSGEGVDGDRAVATLMRLINGESTPSLPEQNHSAPPDCESLRVVVEATGGRLPRECQAGSPQAPNFNSLTETLPDGIHAIAHRGWGKVFAIRVTGRTTEVIFETSAQLGPPQSAPIPGGHQPFGGKGFIAPGQWQYRKSGQRLDNLLVVAEPTPQQRGRVGMIFDTNNNNRPDINDTIGTDHGAPAVLIYAPTGHGEIPPSEGGILLSNVGDGQLFLDILPETFTLVVQP